jgi:hypothetical protein
MPGSRLYILIVFAASFCLPVSPQSFHPQEIILADRIESAAIKAPPELAYIQTSKDIYETGEDLWFKVYLLDAQTLVPSLRSKTLYLQLLKEESKKPVFEEKFEILNGFSNGMITLNGSLSEGDYLLAAYTQFSFFADTSEFKAVKRIKIIKDVTKQLADSGNSERSSLQKSDINRENSIQLNVFPEGGDLVSGILSKLAFKAVNRKGEPVEVKGTLFEDDIPIVKFASKHAGMGCFKFTPGLSKKYRIRMTQPSIDSTFVLPVILSEGMSMSLVARDKEELSFKISQSKGLEESEFYVRIQCRGVVYGMTTGKVTREVLIKVPLSLLPQGIAEVTLFNSNLVPVAERLVYINQDRKLNITTELSSNFFPQRGKAILKIQVKDDKGQPVMANLGVSVFDKLYENTLDSSNILSYVYLSSDLKGRIYNPSFFFNSRSPAREEALDLLMLTQGWRKYVWNELSLSQFEKANRMVVYDGVPGAMYYPERKRKIPKEQTFVMAFSPNIDSFKIVIPADSGGIFTVSPVLLKQWQDDYVYLKPFGSWGSKPVYKKTNPETPQYDLHIRLIDPFVNINKCMEANQIIYPMNSLIYEIKEGPVMQLGNGVIEIEGVTIKGHKENVLRGKYMRSLDSLIKYDLYHDYVCEFGVLNCPRHPRDEYFSTKPVPGDWYFRIIAYGSPGEHVIREPYLPPNFREEELLKMSNLSRVKAYAKVREFYKPDYDKRAGDEMIPDFRNTLLWEPSVFTDSKGEAVLSFFCSDINSTFTGRIEGVGGDGLLGTGFFNFSVRKVRFAPK